MRVIEGYAIEDLKLRLGLEGSENVLEKKRGLRRENGIKGEERGGVGANILGWREEVRGTDFECMDVSNITPYHINSYHIINTFDAIRYKDNYIETNKDSPDSFKISTTSTFESFFSSLLTTLYSTALRHDSQRIAPCETSPAWSC